MYRLTGNLVTPSVVNSYKNLRMNTANSTRITINRRHLYEIARCNQWDTVESYLTSARLQFEAIERAIEERKKLSETIEKEAREHLRGELSAIQAEFGNLEVSSGRWVVVKVEDVQIQDVILGTFKVQLDLRTGQIQAEPNDRNSHNYADGDPHMNYHPHIAQDGSICFGTARDPLDRALAAGLLFDVFEIMKAHLHSYDPNDAYCNLDRWSRVQLSCGDCGERHPSNNLRPCNCECGHEIQLCPSCAVSCISCGRSFCEECTVTCVDCGFTVCDSCLSNTDRCRQCEVRHRERTEGIERRRRDEEQATDNRGIRFIGADGAAS